MAVGLVVALLVVHLARVLSDPSSSGMTLRCMMSRSCQKQDVCELPCEMVSEKPKSDETVSSTAKTTANFIDEEFEELWNEMQDKMKSLNKRQAELLSQQDDLLGQQRKLEKENRQLEEQQSELLNRQDFLEQENKRLKTLITEGDDNDDLRAKVLVLESRIKDLTTQQKKLTSQQKRFVQRQNRLMARQAKLERENKEILEKQAQIEKIGFGASATMSVPVIDVKSRNPPDELQERKLESKFESLKTEMENRISQLTAQQQELLQEQTRLIGRQARLEKENEDLRAQQEQLHTRQAELERENQELKVNLTYSTNDPEEKKERAESIGLCEIEYNGICFGLLGSSSSQLSRDVAQKNCKKYGGDLANVYDEKHYNALRTYFLQKSVASGVWLGMTYNPQNFRLYYSDGTASDFEKWNLLYPVSFSSYTAVYIYYDSDPTSRYSGMVNLPPTWKYPYALCQFGKKEE